MATEFFWEIFPVDSFEDFLKCELREETFVAPNFWCCNVEFRSRWVSFRQKSERKKTRTAQHSPQSGRWLFFGSFSMSGYLLIVDRIPSYHHLSLFQNCAHFSRACIRIFRVLVCCPKSLWKSWWFKLSGFNQSNSVSEFLLILGLPSLGVEQNRQPLLRLRFKESVHIALSHKNQMIETGCYINSEHADATSCSTNTSATSIFQMKSKSSTLRHHSTAKMTINGE